MQIPTPFATSLEFFVGISLLIAAGVTERDEKRCIEKALTEKKTKALEAMLLHTKDLASILTFVQMRGQVWSTILKEVTQSSDWRANDLLKFAKVIIESSEYELLDYIISRQKQLYESSGQPSKDLFGPLLKIAIALKDSKAVTHLVLSGANVHEEFIMNLGKAHPSSTKCSLLHFAVDIGDAVLVNLLLKLDIKPWITDSQNRTPLHCAAQNSTIDLGIVSTLISHGSGVVDAKDDSGYSPLHLAVKYGNESLTRLLLDLEHNPNASLDNIGYSPTHLSIMTALRTYDIFSLSQILLHDPQSINLVFPPNGQTMVHLAAQQEYSGGLLDEILSCRPDLEVFDMNKKTAMQVANPEAREYLLKRGAIWRTDDS